MPHREFHQGAKSASVRSASVWVGAIAALTVLTASMGIIPASIARDGLENGSKDGSPAPAGGVFSPGPAFSEQSGESLFANICQGCHMQDGKGATGAGSFPSLVEDRNLQSAGYAVHVVVNGLRAMPPIGSAMTDAQTAAVVNYVRTHFGNSYQDAVTSDDVKAVRSPKN
jgi:mono/diheme cytochrome c family protein